MRLDSRIARSHNMLLASIGKWIRLYEVIFSPTIIIIEVSVHLPVNSICFLLEFGKLLAREEKAIMNCKKMKL